MFKQKNITNPNQPNYFKILYFIVVLGFILVFIFITKISVLSSPIDYNMAKKVALNKINILKESSNLRQRVSSGYSISETSPLKNEKGDTLAYIIIFDPEGYLITSVDNEICPIIAYSLSGQFPFKNSPDNALLHLVLWDMESRLKALPIFSIPF